MAWAAVFVTVDPHVLFGDVDALADRVLSVVRRSHMVTGLVGANVTLEQLLTWVMVRGPGDKWAWVNKLPSPTEESRI